MIAVTKTLSALALTCICQDAAAFSTATTSRRTTFVVFPSSSPRQYTSSRLSALLKANNDENESSKNNRNPLLAAGLALSIATTALNPANAYVPSDYASDTVQTVISELKQASGNVDATFKVYETIAGIITEGIGVGGMVNYSEYIIITE